MPSALVISFSHLAADPRVTRQIDWLAEEYEVTAAGLSDPGRPGVRFIPVSPAAGSRSLRGVRLLARRHERVYWDTAGPAFAALAGERPDLIVANDLDALPLAVRLADTAGAAVVYDAHEFAPREFDDSWKWRLLRGPYATTLTRRYVPRAAAVTTVGEAIAAAFADLTGVRPTVVTNAPAYHPDLSPSPVAPDRVRLVHHGAAIPARKIENMVRLGPLLDPRFELTFCLVDGVPDYRRHLERMAAGQPRTTFVPPVPMPELPRWLNQFDLGVFLLEPTNFNYRHALPNKFFEFIQGRLGIAIGPTPEMARIVRDTGTGIVADDFRPEPLAAALNRLSAADVERFKRAAHEAAPRLSADANRETWLAVCRGALSGKTTARASGAA
jgi:hypothetical protein